MHFLARLPAASLLQHRATIADMMFNPHDRHGFVRRAASECLERLSEPASAEPTPAESSPPQQQPPAPPPELPCLPISPPPPLDAAPSVSSPEAAQESAARKARRALAEKRRRQEQRRLAEAGDQRAVAKRAAELDRIAKRFPDGFAFAQAQCRRRARAQSAAACTRGKGRARSIRTPQASRRRTRSWTAKQIAVGSGVLSAVRRSQRGLTSSRPAASANSGSQPTRRGGRGTRNVATAKQRSMSHVPCLRSWEQADTRKLPLRCNYTTVREAERTCASCMRARSDLDREAMIIWEHQMHCRNWGQVSREEALQGKVAQIFAKMPDPDCMPADAVPQHAGSADEPAAALVRQSGTIPSCPDALLVRVDLACRLFVLNLAWPWGTTEDGRAASTCGVRFRGVF